MTSVLPPADASDDGDADPVHVVLVRGRLPANRGRDRGIRTSVHAAALVVWREVGGADER